MIDNKLQLYFPQLIQQFKLPAFDYTVKPRGKIYDANA